MLWHAAAAAAASFYNLLFLCVAMSLTVGALTRMIKNVGIHSSVCKIMVNIKTIKLEKYRNEGLRRLPLSFILII